MEVELMRTYHPEGVNGEIWINGVMQCFTIELPWLHNQKQISCIPEGNYLLGRRYSPRFKDHFLVTPVPGRSFILLHPANDARKELKGCIAPVTALTAPGKGTGSRKALEKLRSILYPAMQEQPVYITIKTK